MKKKTFHVSSGKMNVLWVILCSFAALTLIVVGTLGWTRHSLESKVTPLAITSGTLKQGAPLPTSLLGALNTTSDGQPMNILVLGSDTREGQGSEYGNTTDIAGGRSDTTMVVHLAGDRKSAVVLSIPRDLMVTIPDCTSKDTGNTIFEHKEKFNAAFSIGGPSCTIKTVNQITGLPINHAVEIDFSGFKKIVDSVGGIEVCIKEPIDDENASLKIDSGLQLVNGETALGLARARYTLADGSDMARIERQHILFGDLIAHVRKENFLTQPTKLYNLVSSTFESLSTDEGLKTIPAMTYLLLQMKDIPDTNIKFLTLPYIDNNDGSTLSLDETKIREMVQKIQMDILVDEINTPKPGSDSSTSPKPSTIPSQPNNACDNPI